MRKHMRNATRAAKRLLGRLLAEDVIEAERVGDGEWVPRARQVLRLLDELAVMGDEELDRELEALTQGDGVVWLELAEDGRLDGADFVAHVLHHCGVGGYAGPAWVEFLLKAIASADAEHRSALALGVPEYVGLWRAANEVSGGLQRLVAVMDRR